MMITRLFMIITDGYPFGPPNSSRVYYSGMVIRCVKCHPSRAVQQVAHDWRKTRVLPSV